MTAPSPIEDLARFGPDARPAPLTSEQAWDYVRELTMGHYENFSVLSRLVPPRLRADFASVYAFCRWSDDLADETGSDAAARARSVELLHWWRRGLDHCVAFSRGEADTPPAHPVYLMLGECMRRRERVQPEPFHHLIDAFTDDQRVTRYRTWDELLGYCAKSADPVGRIVMQLAGVDTRAPENADLVRMSDATCSALQFINHIQDVRRDLEERDRVYLPSEETGIDAETLRDWIGRGREHEPRLAYIRAVRPLVERTKRLFEAGEPLPNELSARGFGEIAPVVWLFGAGGRAVTRAVERAGCATLWSRPRVSKLTKLSLIARASVKRFTPARPSLREPAAA